MNELLFFGHLALIIGLVLGAVRLGKEALITVICLFAVLANAFIMKQTTLFGLNVTCTDAYAVGSLLALNILQQYHGEEIAKKAANLSLFSLLAFAILSLIQMLYVKSPFDHASSAYTTILTHSPRIVSASVLTFYVIQRFDILFFKMMRKTLPNWPVFLLIAISLVITQSCDTFMFGYLGLYGVVHSVWQISIMALVIKFFAIFFMAPLSGLSKYVIKKETKHAT
ncbi:MAG: queuosine precursor transporter [Rhabdochlamydiaceae bacterium]|nr:queuosine precursor transporter [Candidatus Amphrikana amoebophyrae]